MCIFLLRIGALWDMGLVHCGTCATGLFVIRDVVCDDNLLVSFTPLGLLMNKWTMAWHNTEMSFYRYAKSHCGDKMVVKSSFFQNGTFTFWFKSNKKFILLWFHSLSYRCNIFHKRQEHSWRPMSKTWWSIHYNLDENGTFVEFALQWKDLTKWAEAMSSMLVYQQVHVTKPVPKPCDALSVYPKWGSYHIIWDEGAVTPFKELFYDMSIYMYLKYSINQFHWLKVYFAESLVTGETLSLWETT